MLTITAAQIGLIIGLLSLIGTILGVVFWIQKPVIALKERVQKLEDNDKAQDIQLLTIKDDHTKFNEVMQKDMKDLTAAINGLNISVAKLETKIDERIPKGTPTLTPAGT